jgi:hypothetical protein
MTSITQCIKSLFVSVGQMSDRRFWHVHVACVTSSSSCYPIKPWHQRHRPRAPLERKEEGALLHYVCNYCAHPKLAQDTVTGTVTIHEVDD